MENEARPIVASHGFVRNRTAFIGLDQSVDGIHLAVVATPAQGENYGPETKSTIPLQPADHPGIDGWPSHTYTALLPDGIVVSAIPSVVGPDDHTATVDLGEGYFLHALLPRDKAALAKYLFHRRSRISDTETLVFMLRQILASPRHKPLHKLEAVKILSYRALESLVPEQMAEIYGLVDLGFEQTEQYRFEVSVEKGAVFQESQYQARVSLRTARWYASMLLGNYERAFEDAEWLMASVPQAYKIPTISYNCAITVLAYGQIFRMAGETDKALAAFDAVVGFFRAAAAEMPSQPPATFRELTIPFQAALAASEAGRYLDGKSTKGVLDVTPARIAEDFCRLRTKTSKNAFARAIVEASEYLRNGQTGIEPHDTTTPAHS